MAAEARWGQKRTTGTDYDDGKSRQFELASADPRMVVAVVIATRDGWAEIRPSHWADAGAVVKALKDAGMVRTVRERKAVAK